MRWIEPIRKDWTSVYDEGANKDRITIEKGEHNVYRLTYWRGDSEACIPVHAETADEMAKALVNEGMLTDEEARAVARKIIH